MQALFAISNQYDDVLIALVLTIPRVYAFMDSSQLLSSSSVPGICRIGAMIALVLFLSPMNLGYAHGADHAMGAFILLFAKEYAIGVVLGYFVAWIFWVVQTAGTFIDNQRGASIASSIDPLLGAESSPLGDLFSLVFITYIFTTGSVFTVLNLLFGSFKLWPLFEAWPALPPDFPRLILGIFDYSMRLGFDIAAPVIAVMFLAEFSLAMVSRFAPQVQVFVLAMPIKSILAIFMLVFYANVLFPYVNSQIPTTASFSYRFYQIIGVGRNFTPSESTLGGTQP